MSRIRVRVASLVLVVALMMAFAPSLAYAGVSEYQVQFAPIGLSGRMDIIVNVVLSPDTPLPATVRVPLPKGATILWSGEILGGDPGDDPAHEATLTASGGAQYAEFTLEKVRVAQVEAELTQATTTGDQVEATLDWINTTDVGTYTFSVRLEPNVGDVKLSPTAEGSPQVNSDGESLYVLAPVRLEKDGKFTIDVTYRRGVAASGGGLSPLLLGALGLLVITVLALVVVLLKQSPAPAAAPPQPRPTGSAKRSSQNTPEPGADASADEPDDEAFTWD